MYRAKEREKVWIALSDLFLDTDVSFNYEFVARECAQSLFSLEELEKILKTEVAPVCSPNLVLVAGEWTGFDERWLVDNICEYISGRKRFWYNLNNLFCHYWFNSYVETHWDNVSNRINKLREHG